MLDWVVVCGETSGADVEGVVLAVLTVFKGWLATLFVLFFSIKLLFIK